MLATKDKVDGMLLLTGSMDDIGQVMQVTLEHWLIWPSLRNEAQRRCSIVQYVYR